MSGILRLESLTKGNTLKQGDKTPLKYKLFDADGDILNVAGKPAKVRLVYPDFLTIGYEKDGLTVAQDDTVTFTIDSIIPSRIYHVEIIVDDQFIFPSRADESKFTVDKSSLGTETNIIEIIGVDQIVNKVLGKVDADIGQAITDINMTNETIQQAEAERARWFEDTQIKLENLATYDKLSYVDGAEAYVKDNEVIITNLSDVQGQVSVDFTDGGNNVYHVSGELQTDSSEDSVRTVGLDSNVIQFHSGDGTYMKYSFAVTSNSASVKSFRFLNSPRSGSVPEGTLKLRNTMMINLTQVFGAGREPSVELMDYLMSGLGYFSTHTLTLGDILRMVTSPSDEDIDTSSLVNEVLGHINPTINDLTARMDNIETEGVPAVIEQGSVTPEKTSFLEPYIAQEPPNLFDKADIIISMLLDVSDGVTLTQDSQFNTSNFIKVEPNSIIYKNKMGSVVMYDSNKSRVTSFGFGHGAREYEVPHNVEWVRVSLLASDTEDYRLEKVITTETRKLSSNVKVSSDNLVDVDIDVTGDVNDILDTRLPTEIISLPMELPFNIYKAASQYYTDLNIEKYKTPVNKRYYVDNVNGTQGGTGTIDSPMNSIHRAIRQTDCDEIIIKEGMYGWSSGIAGFKPLNDINIIADGNVVVGSFRENVSYTQDPTYTNVYHAPERNIAYVVDLTDINRPVMYKKVSSIEECNDTSRSYYVNSNTDVYVNTGKGEPDGNVFLMLANPALASDDFNVYLENITFVNTVSHNSTIEPRKTLYANSCNFYFSSAGNCVSTTGSDSIMVKCSAQYSDRDGFNYHERGDIKPFAIEVDCTARYNGLDGADQNNGSTMHDGGTVVRVGGVYEQNHGPNVIDVNEGGKSYNVGVKASRSTATAGTVSNSDFKNGNIGRSDMMLIDCTSFGSDYSVVTVGGGDTVIEGGFILGEVIEI